MNSIFRKISNNIESNRPVIYINHYNYDIVDHIIKELFRKKQKNVKIFEYDDATKYSKYDIECENNNIEIRKQKIDSVDNIFDALEDAEYLANGNNNYKIIFVLKEPTEMLKNPNIIGSIKNIIQRSISDYNSIDFTFLMISTEIFIPKEIEKFVWLTEIPYPDEEKIYELVNKHTIEIKDLFNFDDNDLRNIVLNLKGLTEYEIEQILNLANREGLENNIGDYIEFLSSEKQQIVKKSDIVEFISNDDKNKLSIHDVGGLIKLKNWLNTKNIIFKNINEAKGFGVDIPKGVLITGMPGCGKSLTAKAAATLFKLPLIRLDIGKLLGKYVGESENNMRKAIKVAEAVSPCVLWIDEVEKAFGNVSESNSNEVTLRLFGYFLTWMQEKNSNVFVIATSNNINSLPPEFLRKGRFDEVFYVDFPSMDEISEIFKIHFRKRKKNIGYLVKDLNKLASIVKSDQKNNSGNKDYEYCYSGADIEAIVSSVIEKAFIDNKRDIVLKDIEDEIKNTQPISVTLGEKIKLMKEAYKKYNIKPAS